MPASPTVEELLAEREARQKERKELEEKAHSALGEIDGLRQIIASLQHKLFGNGKGEEVTKTLDIVPMKFVKIRLVRPRYVRAAEREQPPVCAPLPATIRI